MKAFFRFLVSWPFWLNLGIAIGAFFLTGYLLLNWLDGYTRHGEKIRVPNLVGIHVDEIPSILRPLGLNYELDSVYVLGQQPGTIYIQDPQPTDCTGVHAKEGRTIYLSMIRFTPPGKFVNPKKYIGHSKREVITKLEGLGFKIIEKYEPNPDNFVLDVRYKGKSINPEEQIVSGETIQVVIGNGRKVQVPVPDLMGKTISEAKKSLGNIALNMIPAECIGCVSSEDSSRAVIVRQFPEGGPEAAAAAGSDLMIWLSTKPGIPDDSQD